MIHYPMVNEDYINGYLEAISRIKDILTHYVGGSNQFFSIPKNKEKSLLQNIQQFIVDNGSYYSKYLNVVQFQELLDNIQLEEIPYWETNFQHKIKEWTCDDNLSKVCGKNGFYLSEYLVEFILKDFFKNTEVKAYKLYPDWGIWHWAEQMNKEFIFENSDKIYIMHFGESS